MAVEVFSVLEALRAGATALAEAALRNEDKEKEKEEKEEREKEEDKERAGLGVLVVAGTAPGLLSSSGASTRASLQPSSSKSAPSASFASSASAPAGGGTWDELVVFDHLPTMLWFWRATDPVTGVESASDAAARVAAYAVRGIAPPPNRVRLWVTCRWEPWRSTPPIERRWYVGRRRVGGRQDHANPRAAAGEADVGRSG